jgi:hypothetical protein
MWIYLRKVTPSLPSVGGNSNLTRNKINITQKKLITESISYKHINSNEPG